MTRVYETIGAIILWGGALALVTYVTYCFKKFFQSIYNFRTKQNMLGSNSFYESYNNYEIYKELQERATSISETEGTETRKGMAYQELASEYKESADFWFRDLECNHEDKLNNFTREDRNILNNARRWGLIDSVHSSKFVIVQKTLVLKNRLF